jgi:uncharacterized protein YciI
MKLVRLLLVLLVACAARQVEPVGPEASMEAASANPPAACPAPGAGTLEMKPYFLVLLRRGPAWTPEKTPETTKLFEGHMANIIAMGKTGKLVIAGPIDAAETDRTAVAGIFIFDVATRAEVEAMIGNDPSIAAKRLVPEILPWYGPAGLTFPGQREARAH